MTKLKQIFLHRAAGSSYQGISQILGVSRNTVKKYIRLAEQKRLELATLAGKAEHELEALFAEPVVESQERYQDLESLFPWMVGELEKVGVTRWTLWGEYKARFPDGYSYGRFCEHLRRWEQRHEATMHLEHAPGEKLFMDFTGKRLETVDRESGEVRPREVYVAILACSGLTYVEAVPSQKRQDLTGGTENALRYFGGVPQVLVPDNLKAAVSKADKYEPVINEGFLDFANHYGAAVMPARSRKPRDKALVENAVRLVYSRIFAPLRNRTFFSLGELNEAIHALLEQHNNAPLQKESCSRREKFIQKEAAHLQPLPENRYQIRQYKTAKVMKNCHVQLEKHYYSVPYRYIGRQVKLIYTRDEVRVFCAQDQIAWHARAEKPFGYTTQAEHLPSSHRFVSEWSAEKFLGWAERIAPEVKAYIQTILERKRYPEQAYRACVGILSLEKKVGRERLVASIKRASYYQIYHYKAIKKIIEGGLDRLFEEEQTRLPTLPFHENIRGKDQYQ